jgi:hypothetical protein
MDFSIRIQSLNCKETLFSVRWWMTKETWWYKLKGRHILYCGHPQIVCPIGEIFRSNGRVWARVDCNPKTGEPWKTMKEAKAWLEKETRRRK